MTSIKERSSRLLVRVAAGAALALLATSAGAEAKHGHGYGDGSSQHVSAIVLNPAGLEAIAPTDLTITKRQDADGNFEAVEVSSSTTGTNHWVHLPLSLPAASHSGKGRAHDLFVIAVEVCATRPSGTFIDTLRLTEIDAAGAATIVHNDEDTENEVDTCFKSEVGVPFAVEEALTLSMNLSFGATTDVIRFGTIRILLTPRPERFDPSEPSEPSHSSGPGDSSGRDDD